MLSPRSVSVFHLTFRSTICFKWIFVMNDRSVLDESFCIQMSSCSSTIYWSRISLILLIAFASLSKIHGLYSWCSISGLPVLFHWSICLLFCQYHTLLITVPSCLLFGNIRCSQWQSFLSPELLFSTYRTSLPPVPLTCSTKKLLEHGKFVEDGVLHHFFHWKAFQAAG